MKRGHIWTVAGGPDYAGKPRPAIVLQDDAFDATASITVYPLTTQSIDAQQRHARRTGVTPGHILRVVLATAGRPAGIGVAIGLLAAIVGTRALGSLLFGVQLLDGTTYTGVVALVLSVVAVASYLPARRAARIEPMALLKQE